MDIKPQAQQPISDDQELAKVLAGINQENEESAASATTAPDPAPAPAPAADEPVEEPAAEVEAPAEAATAAPQPTPEPVVEMPDLSSMSASVPSGDSSLDSIKQEALGELRPLVDKLNVSPEEKFDAYLLLLRTTDDKALIAPAHEEAKNITDEARRAQALLDIIKEIDFLSGAHQS